MAGLSHRTIGFSLLALLFCAGVATAQENERGFGFLEQLFGNGDRAPDNAPPDPSERGGPNAGRMAQSSGDLTMRLDRLEAQIRQLTGAIEQLQYRNQQLEGQLRRGQPDADYRIQEGAAPRSTPPARPVAPPAATQPPAAPPGRRGDAFDPNLNPNA